MVGTRVARQRLGAECGKPSLTALTSTVSAYMDHTTAGAEVQVQSGEVVGLC